MSSTGTTMRRSSRLLLGGAATVTGRAPPRNDATTSAGLTVADRPMRCAGARPGSSASSRSRDRARCAPRLLPASACTSSTMTVSTLRSTSRALEVSSRNRDSGVVIRMSGGRAARRRRSSGLLSPVRTATWMSGGLLPIACAVCRIPVSGARRLRSMSTARALSGEMYSTRHWRSASEGVGAAASRSSAQRNAASVLPEPVGAITSVFSPLPMAAQAWTCASVGAAKAAVNQSRVTALNPSMGSRPGGADMPSILPAGTDRIDRPARGWPGQPGASRTEAVSWPDALRTVQTTVRSPAAQAPASG